MEHVDNRSRPVVPVYPSSFYLSHDSDSRPFSYKPNFLVDSHSGFSEHENPSRVADHHSSKGISHINSLLGSDVPQKSVITMMKTVEFSMPIFRSNDTKVMSDMPYKPKEFCDANLFCHQTELLDIQKSCAISKGNSDSHFALSHDGMYSPRALNHGIAWKEKKGFSEKNPLNFQVSFGIGAGVSRRIDDNKLKYIAETKSPIRKVLCSSERGQGGISQWPKMVDSFFNYYIDRSLNNDKSFASLLCDNNWLRSNMIQLAKFISSSVIPQIQSVNDIDTGLGQFFKNNGYSYITQNRVNIWDLSPDTISLFDIHFPSQLQSVAEYKESLRLFHYRQQLELFLLPPPYEHNANNTRGYVLRRMMEWLDDSLECSYKFDYRETSCMPTDSHILDHLLKIVLRDLLGDDVLMHFDCDPYTTSLTTSLVSGRSSYSGNNRVLLKLYRNDSSCRSVSAVLRTTDNHIAQTRQNLEFFGFRCLLNDNQETKSGRSAAGKYEAAKKLKLNVKIKTTDPVSYVLQDELENFIELPHGNANIFGAICALFYCLRRLGGSESVDACLPEDLRFVGKT